MAKQYSPSKAELTHYNRLASEVFSEMTGARVDVSLTRHEMEVDHTKSEIFAAGVTGTAERTVRVPSPVVFKHYIKGDRPRTSGLGTLEEEFLKERVILGLDIKIRTPWSHGEEVRVYPESFGVNHPSCVEDNTIIREYIEGTNLKQIAEAQQESKGKISWGAPFGEDDISEFLLPISILHVNSARIMEELYRHNLSKQRKIEEVSPDDVVGIRKQRGERYFGILLRGAGKNSEDISKITEAYAHLDRKFVSRPELLTVVDGELDVFPHHAMIRRIPDAGGVEVGGLVRDLAVYSAPCFNDLWERAVDLPVKITEYYFTVRNRIENNLGHGNLLKTMGVVSKEEFGLGILLTSFFGNMRRAAAIIHYDGTESPASVEEEVTSHLTTGRRYLEEFGSIVKGEDKAYADTLLEFSDRHNLGTEPYKLKRDAGLMPRIKSA